MFDAIMTLLAKSVSADMLGGWVRAGVAAVLGLAAGWFGGVLAPFLTPDFQAALGLVVATIVVGVWSSMAKKYAGPTEPPPAA
jgi:uncharacterized membrane protein (DUF106 family)